ncbi:putative immune-type receptor 10a isoform X2 [Silurus meridionalis]|nr:putative immune-type receptor 10a isoform X2 [Silurus meridionalis]
MVEFGALPLFLCVMGLFSESLCFVTLEAEVGDNVTIWCQHELILSGYIHWFKHTCGSAPLIIGCKQFFGSVPSQNCNFFNESERMVVSVQGENTSLTITAVNVSDTGLYYCSSTELMRITFHDTNYLRVKGSEVEDNQNQQVSEKLLKKISDEMEYSYAVFSPLRQ